MLKQEPETACGPRGNTWAALRSFNQGCLVRRPKPHRYLVTCKVTCGPAKLQLSPPPRQLGQVLRYLEAGPKS